MEIGEYVPGSGRVLREDDTLINTANVLVPRPNGDETITVDAAGIKTLTPPNDSNIKARIYVPKDCYVRFGAVPSVGIGTYFAKGDEIQLESAEEIDDAQIYVTEACTLFVQYYK